MVKELNKQSSNTKPKEEWVSIPEFAKRANRSKTNIYKQVRSGYFGEFYDEKTRKLKIPEALVKYDLIKNDNMQIGKRARDLIAKQSGKSAEKKNNPNKGLTVYENDTEELKEMMDYGIKLNRAKANKIDTESKLKELELKVKLGELIDKSETKENIRIVLNEYKSILITLPSRVALDCVGKQAREIEALIQKEIHSLFVIFKDIEFVE